MATFEVGNAYRRDDIAELVDMPPERRGGAWDTGYDEWNGEVFIFANVGIPGRTGHDYGNRWEGKNLLWFGKTRSKLGQPQINRIVSNTVPVHIFWRGADRSPFTYAGIGRAVLTSEGSPVEVLWSFEVAPEASPVGATEPVKHSPAFRRGPPPAHGEITSLKHDGPTSVYVLRLQGPSLVEIPDDHVVIKVGMSNNIGRRLSELNVGFPPGSRAKWVHVVSRELSTGDAAFELESACLETLRRAGKWIGGEFAVLATEQVPHLLD